MAVPARCKLGPKRSRPILGGGITERKYEPISCTPFLPFSDDMCHLRLLLDLTQRIEAPDGRLDSVWIVGVLHPDSVYHPPIAIPPGGELDEFYRSLRVRDRTDFPIGNPLVEVPRKGDLLPVAPRSPEKHSLGRLQRFLPTGDSLIADGSSAITSWARCSKSSAPMEFGACDMTGFPQAAASRSR